MCTARQALDLLLGYIRIRSGSLRHMLILGTNPRAVAFARRVLASRERGYHLLGFVDDEWPGLAEFKKTGFQVVSGYAGLANFLRHNIVDEVAIYLPVGTFTPTILRLPGFVSSMESSSASTQTSSVSRRRAGGPSLSTETTISPPTGK